MTRLLAVGDALACEIDALGRHVGEFEIGDGGDRDALGDEIALVDPAADDALRVAEQADGQVLARVAEARLDETLGDVVGDRARPYFLKHPRRDLDALADDALQQHGARADVLRRQYEPRVVGELSLEALAGEIDPIALDAGEDNFERGALLDRLDAEDRLWRSDRRDDWLGGEGEGDAEDIGVFDRE